jgi:YfiH family protein
MPFFEENSIRRFVFENLQAEHLIHGVFTRRGGVSPAPWKSLNLGGTNGDEKSNIVENRRRIFASTNLPVNSIYDPWQVHGIDVLRVDNPRPLDTPHIQADAVMTQNPEVTLFMRFADCTPIFLYDPIHRVIGLAHAGWKGTVNRIGSEIVRAMQREYQTLPSTLIAGIGPCIGPDHYEIGSDVDMIIRDAFVEKSEEVLTIDKGRIFFDLWTANRIILEEAGVENIQVAGICTSCNNEDWFSHRYENGKTGRFGALITLMKTGIYSKT